MKILLALLALLMPAAALAADGVSLVSKVFVERVETTPEGRSVDVSQSASVDADSWKRRSSARIVSRHDRTSAASSASRAASTSASPATTRREALTRRPPAVRGRSPR